MRVIYKLLISIIVFDLSIDASSEFFNLTLTVPNVTKPTNNQQLIYIAAELPKDDELYMIDFYPMYDRRNVQFITTYLCSQAYSTEENFWFGDQPCYFMDQSMTIYEWYYNIPAVQWPQDAGFRVGTSTSYRYVVICIQYLSFVINSMYGERITMTRTRPKYKIGTHKITNNLFDFQKNHVDFSCLYLSSSIYIFSALPYSNPDGRSISLYRVRNNQLQTIIKGNLRWPQTFYQLQNITDIQVNDYLIGTCSFESKPTSQLQFDSSDLVCQITVMFWMKQADPVPSEVCPKNDHPRAVQRFFPVVMTDVPQTLFDINPTYPKVSPDQWAAMNRNISLAVLESMNNKTHVLYLTYSKNDRRHDILRFLHTHKILVVISIWTLLSLIGFFILLFIMIRSRKNKKYISMNKIRTKSINVGGDNGSLSGWLTKRRFQHYEDDLTGENEPLTRKHRWASDTEDNELSDTEVFNSTDFRNVTLKN